MSDGNKSFQASSLFNLKGRVALVTGGGSGIGLMATQALAANGAKVYIAGRTQEKLDAVVKQYNTSDLSGEIIGIQADIANKEGISKLCDEISSREKCLCILINNAGVSSGKQQSGASDKNTSAEDLRKNLFEGDVNTFADWQETFQTNVTGMYFTTAAFLPLLQKSSELHKGWSGTVLNITSISGLIKSAQKHFAYNASKAAAIHLTRMLANEVSSAAGSGDGKIQLRINSIAPGIFPSEMTANESDSQQKSSLGTDVAENNNIPAGRPGKDEDMAGAILFAVANQYLSGETIVVDGGLTLSGGM